MLSESSPDSLELSQAGMLTRGLGSSSGQDLMPLEECWNLVILSVQGAVGSCGEFCGSQGVHDSGF